MKKQLILASVLCGCVASTDALAAYKPGFHLGGLEITPVINAGLAWESNINDTYKDEESGMIWRVQPAVSATYSARRTLFTLNGFYTYERGFDSDDGADSDSYGLSGALIRDVGINGKLTMNFAYTRSEDDQFYFGGTDANGNTIPSSIDEDERESYNASASYGYRGPRWMYSFGGGWHRSRQLDGWKTTNDSYNVSTQAGIATSATNYLSSAFSISADDPEHGGTSMSYTLMAGVNGNFSERTSYSAMAGVSYYDYSGLVDDTSFSPAYSVSLAKKLTRRLSVALALSSRYEAEDSGLANLSYVWSHHLTSSMNYTIDDLTSLRLDLAAVFEEHTGVAEGMKDYDRIYFNTRLSLYRKISEVLTGFASVSWRRDDNDDREKDNIRAEVGVSLKI